MKSAFKSCLSFTMILSLTYAPLVAPRAMAGDTSDEFHNVCDQAISDVDNKRSTTGDQHAAYCVQADLARRSKNVETAKSVIYLAAAAVCTTMAILQKVGDGEVDSGTAMLADPYTAAAGAALVATGNGLIADAKVTCPITTIAATAGGLGLDIGGGIVINNAKDRYGQAKDQICSVSTFEPVMSTAMQFMMTGAKVTLSKSKASNNEKSGCVACALMNALTGAVSLSQSISSKNAQKKFVQDAKEMSANTNDSVSHMSPAQTNLTAQTRGNDTPLTPSSGTSGSGSTDCASQPGNSYLSCIGAQSPEISAITNSPDFMNAMSKALHGKSLGDFVKGYDGNSDMAAYVGAGLGMSPDAISAIIKGADKIAKDSGMDKYTPSGYTHAGGTKTAANDDLDFNKMMAGMMGKLNPDAAKDGKADPSDLVFRQLELLPADKIESNKDISLFARIAFRYRKNSDNVEQLNWARTENQSGPAPASVPAQKK